MINIGNAFRIAAVVCLGAAKVVSAVLNESNSNGLINQMNTSCNSTPCQLNNFNYDDYTRRYPGYVPVQAIPMPVYQCYPATPQMVQQYMAQPQPVYQQPVQPVQPVQQYVAPQPVQPVQTVQRTVPPVDAQPVVQRTVWTFPQHTTRELYPQYFSGNAAFNNPYPQPQTQPQYQYTYQTPGYASIIDDPVPVSYEKQIEQRYGIPFQQYVAAQQAQYSQPCTSINTAGWDNPWYNQTIGQASTYENAYTFNGGFNQPPNPPPVYPSVGGMYNIYATPADGINAYRPPGMSEREWMIRNL